MEETATFKTQESIGGSEETGNNGLNHGNNDNNNGISPSSGDGKIIFPPTERGVQHSIYRHEHPLFPERRRGSRLHPRENDGPANRNNGELMGPILRRKKVVSMPLGAGGDFFVSDDLGGPHRQLETIHSLREKQRSYEGPASGREKQQSHDSSSSRKRQVTPTSPAVASRRRAKQNSFLNNLVRRKQISLDLLGPNDFFAIPTEEEEAALAEVSRVPSSHGEILAVPEDEEVGEGKAEGKLPAKEKIPEKKEEKQKKLFLPLRFSPPVLMGPNKRAAGHTGGHGPTPEVAHGPSMFVTTTPQVELDEETTKALRRQSRHSEMLRIQLSSLQNKIDEEEEDAQKKDMFLSVSNRILETQKAIEEDQKFLLQKLDQNDTIDMDESETIHAAHEEGSDMVKPSLVDKDEDDGIVHADRPDKIKAAIVFVIMLAFTVVVCTWDTHVAAFSHIYSAVGLACVTSCPGNLETRDFFHGHNHFESGEVIQLIMHLDPNVEAGEAHTVVEVVGEESGVVKAVKEMGPVSPEIREHLNAIIKVDFDDPEEHHIINVNSTNPEIELSFTLLAEVKTPLANYSVLVAALIMVVVYAFILVEVIHRTLVAIFGSMLALMFLFIMSGGYTESVKQIMLSMEWSTLGLLFGMMLLVGELSHTGIFEWCAVRLLMASRGSFNLLMILLGVLTAVASAFLDNVTTMLLVAPVTIDMCSILGVDPRPYLIGEVLLSNVGGTATLIGDPPNIIIGTSYDEIDFVGFIVNVLPAIFIFIIPVTVALILWIYRYYFCSSKMRVLDTVELKKTYPIYDEPRLMIAGTATAFVILIFFLHSVHHKDTAWIALFGAFVTIAFTNPHDVQDALRNHVEWDTLLFFAGLFVLVEACAHMGLLEAIGGALASYIESQPEESQPAIAITLVIWVSAIVSAFLDNIPYTATMIPVVQILADELDTLDLATLAWALSFGACLGGNGTLLGASANIVTAGISKNKGFDISFLNFLYPGMLVMIASVAIANLYMLIRYVWI